MFITINVIVRNHINPSELSSVLMRLFFSCLSFVMSFRLRSFLLALSRLLAVQVDFISAVVSFHAFTNTFWVHILIIVKGLVAAIYINEC